LVAALPAFLGFIPTEAVVVVALTDGEVLFVARHDIAAISYATPTIIDAARHHHATSVIIVAIASDPETGAIAATGTAHTAELMGIEITHVLYTPSCEEGNLWADLRTNEAGMTEDYRTTTLALTRSVQSGRTIAGSRENLRDLFTLDDTADIDTPRTLLDITRELYAVINRDDTATAELAAHIGSAVAENITYRDALITVASHNYPAAAATFIQLANALRDEKRAAVLTLVVAAAALAGNGALANVAVEDAERSAIELPPLMTLIDSAMRAGVSPAQLAQVVPTPEVARDTIGGDYTT
ncbi:MAG: hypothetical protein C0482_30020, partial [Gordonia sp.]|nr:hypothetical protein [Gordonia sp. (in: high G+C Gram-positive bacteria)]